MAMLLSLCTAHASAAYNAAYCQTVANTLNIHWQATSGPFTPCTGIETTDGTLADAADGSITMTGTGVSNASCIGTAAYTFTLSGDTLQLTGSDTASNIPMTLTRGPGEQCFVGAWVAGADAYEAHIWAGAFPLLQTSATPVPGPAGALLALLAAMVGAAGALGLRRKA
jgi:hypothetical protein